MGWRICPGLPGRTRGLGVECACLRLAPGLCCWCGHMWCADVGDRFTGLPCNAIHSLIHFSAFFGRECHVALDRNQGSGYDTLLLWMIPGDFLSACPQRKFHTLPGLIDSRAALPNSYPNALRAMQGGSLHHLYDSLWYDPPGTQIRDLQHSRLGLPAAEYTVIYLEAIVRIYRKIIDMS